MALIAADYRRQLQALLPSGPAWPRALGATLTRFLDAVAAEFARIGTRVTELFDQADPRTTSDLLPDWERVAGLPDNCSGTLRATLQGRRADLVSKLASTGGQSRDYFIGIAADLGFQIEIEEIRPFRVGQSAVGDPLSNGGWRYTWRVRAADQSITRFRVGRSAVGEPLAIWGNASLECRIRQLAPAHTRVIFAYGGLRGVLLLDDGTALLVTGGIGLLLESP